MGFSTIYFLLSTALRLRRQWTCRELNPEALSASQSADPSVSPLVMSVTRVGFEPDLAGLKDQQPHQKLNEPWCFLSSVSAHLLRSCSSGVFALDLCDSFRCFTASGLGGARTLLFGSSDRRYTVSATSPSAQ